MRKGNTLHQDQLCTVSKKKKAHLLGQAHLKLTLKRADEDTGVAQTLPQSLSG